MKNKIEKHRWNVVCVKKYTYPMPNPIEFFVESKNLLSAAALAKKRLRNLDDDWKIKTIYWLDPFWYNKEEK